MKRTILALAVVAALATGVQTAKADHWHHQHGRCGTPTRVYSNYHNHHNHSPNISYYSPGLSFSYRSPSYYQGYSSGYGGGYGGYGYNSYRTYYGGGYGGYGGYGYGQPSCNMRGW